MKTYLWASDSSRLTGPSKNSPPSPLSEGCDHKGDLQGLFIKAEFSEVNSGASRPYRSGSLNTWHLLFSSPSGSQVWKRDKVLIVPFLPPFFDGSRGYWSETTCLWRCLPGYSSLPGSLPTSLHWLIKVLLHQTLMLTRFTGASAEHVMSRYHHTLTMVIEGQLHMPCKDAGSTTTSMRGIKKLAAYVLDLHVRQPHHIHKKKKCSKPTSDKAALRCDDI